MDLYQVKELLLKNVARKLLSTKKKEITFEMVDSEAGRLERVAEQYYIQASEPKEYNQFIIDWLNDNSYKILKTEEFSYDVYIPNNGYENNVENYIKK